MESDKLFVIAIGGTGMRCLESFVHLCAAGLFDNKEIEILTLDTDQSNGNKSRVEGLVQLYNKVKTNDASDVGGKPNTNTFFSAKLNLYQFYTEYDRANRKSYRVLSQVSNLNAEQKQNNEDLADLLLDRETVQEFELDHGYRAQTHLGSMLMYHGIIEAAIRAKRGGKDVKEQELALQKFVQLIQKNAGNARIFIFGSVFGGTGASSIPVVPIALRDAVGILSDGNNSLNLSNVKFGSTLLTDYFIFNPPTNDQLTNDHVIASSDNFAINSQAALQFYLSDPTVINFYKRLYHIGWPAAQKLDVSKRNEGLKTITGGAEQKNPCHVVELLCACAAYDFFTTNITEQQATYLYRNVEVDPTGQNLRLTGTSFIGDGDKFENKLGAFLSFAHLALSTHQGAFGHNGNKELLGRFEEQKITEYEKITDEQAKEIDDYLKMFAYDVVDGNLIKGWIYQVNETIPGTFIFNNKAFETNVSALSKVDPGNVFTDDKHNWNGGGFMKSSRYDNFIKGLIDSHVYPKAEQNVTTTKEKYLAHLYNAITKAQKYEL